MSPRRGYVLLEALIGGALIACVLAALFVQAGAAHVKIVDAGRRTTATHLAQVAVEREIARGFFRAQSSSAQTLQAGGASYTRVVVVGGEQSMSGVRFKDVTSEVSYVIIDGGRQLPRSVRVSSRVWSP